MAWQEGYKKISAQNPLPTDGDSIYAKDIDIGNSDIGTFTGDILSLFNDYNVEIVDESATNPKWFKLRFHRPVKSNQVALGSMTGDFSNVKVQLKDLAGTVRTVVDDSANDTDLTSNVYPFTTNVFIEALIEFHTADAVKISGMFIPKVQSRAISAIDGYVSETNTSEDALGIGGIFTGGQVDTLNYGMAIVSVYSDVASATDGLAVQFRSTPSGTWRSADNYTIAALSEKTFSIQTVRRFMRIIYTNGGVGQTVFDLQTVLKPVYVKPSSHRVTDSITGQDDAELVKAVSTGLAPDGNFKNVLVTNAGETKVSLEAFDEAFDATPLPVGDYGLWVSRSLVTGMDNVNKYGGATDGVQLTPTDIWDRADAAATQQIWLAPTAARIHTLVSTSIQDDGTPEGAGSGAQVVRVSYLPSWGSAEATEDVVMNGTAGVAMNNAAVIIHRMKVIELGTTYNINVGNITATAAVDATITAQINAGNGQTLMAIYGVPSTHRFCITGYIVSAHNTGNPSTVTETDFTMLINERPDLNPLAFLNKSNLGTIATGSTSSPRVYDPPFCVNGPAIIKFQAVTTLADTEAVAEFDGYLETL